LPALEAVELPPAASRRIGGAEDRLAAKGGRLEELRRERKTKVIERLEAMKTEREQKAKVNELRELLAAGHIHPQPVLEYFNLAEIRPAYREPLFKPWVDLVIKDSLTVEDETVEISEELREQLTQLAYGSSSQRPGFFRGMAPNVGEFRKKIQKARGEWLASAAEQARRAAEDLEKLRIQAEPIMADPVAALEAELPRIGYGGAIGVPMLLNAAAETRLLKIRDGILLGHTQITGGSGAGKSYTVKRGLRALLPDEAVIELDVSSPRLLVYDERSYKFKVLILNEADALPGRRAESEDNVGAVIVRSLLSENRVKYETLVKDSESPTGQRRASIEREGPTVLITAIVDAISPTSQLGTRLQSVPVPEDAEQDAAALEAQADTEDRGFFLPTNPAILAHRMLHQRMAEADGGLDVVVPFYRAFARLLRRRRGDGRLKRDSARFLSTIKGVTLLRLEQRQRDGQGRFISTFDDYSKFIEWAEPIYENSVTGVNADIREMVDVIRELTSPEGPRPQTTVTVRQILVGLNQRRRAQAALEGRQIPREVTRRTVSSWIKRAVELGYVRNRTEAWQQRAGYTGMFELGEELPPPTALPTVTEIQDELQRLE
jgi:hypothetical protein